MFPILYCTSKLPYPTLCYTLFYFFIDSNFRNLGKKNQ